MQHRSNNDLHTFPSEKGKGIAGAAVIHIVLLLLLVLISFSVPPLPETEEGILVNFGTGETGMGMIEPSNNVIEETTPPPLQNNSSTDNAEDPILTQNFEEAPEVKKVTEEKKDKEQAETERKRMEQLEAERKQREQEELEKKRIEEQKKREADIINRTKNALANSRNTDTQTESEGVAGGDGNQGSLTGSVDSKIRGDGSGKGENGISYDLQGRGFQSLPSPKYDYQGEGKVVVNVSVDRSGKVIQAIPGTKGSTTLDEYLLKVAKDAAMNAIFEAKPDAPAIQKGSITYNFILR